jgi:hypothetical protein
MILCGAVERIREIRFPCGVGKPLVVPDHFQIASVRFVRFVWIVRPRSFVDLL